MPTYRILYRSELGRLEETVTADRLTHQGSHIVFYSTAWITGQPREIIARRLIRTELDRITVQPNDKQS